MKPSISEKQEQSGKTSPKKHIGKRRSSIEIVADILRAGENGAGKTEIMYTANMSYKQTQHYLGFLTEHGFVKSTTNKSSGTCYRVTDAGSNLLGLIDSLMNVLGSGHSSLL